MSRLNVSRREFARTGCSAMAALGLSGVKVDAQQPAATSKPDALRSEFLMDLVLNVDRNVGGTIGALDVIGVTGGTFEGPRLRGTAISPGADWLRAGGENLRVMDVRTLLMTNDNQRIYLTYRGLFYTPPQGQGSPYQRIVPVFETASPKYAWLNRIIAVGVGFPVPQSAAYRIFQIL